MVSVAFLFRPKKCEIPCRSSAVTLAKQMMSGSSGSTSHRGESPEESEVEDGVGDSSVSSLVAMLLCLAEMIGLRKATKLEGHSVDGSYEKSNPVGDESRKQFKHRE